MHNFEIAEALQRIADLLEIDGANRFRVLAYRNAGMTISALEREVGAMIASGQDLSLLPGIGEDLAAKITELYQTGSLPILHELEQRVPAGLVDVMSVPGLGPARTRRLRDVLGVGSVAALREAAEQGRIRNIPGFGARSEKAILEGLSRMTGYDHRTRLADAEQIAAPLLRFVCDIPGVREAVIGGSFRRQRETVGDLDLIVVASPGSKVTDRIVAYDEIGAVTQKGATRSSFTLKSGFRVDVRVVPDTAFGAALIYFTGSKAHNIALRRRAIAMGWKLNEYGLYEGSKRIAGRTETEVYGRLSLPYIAPQLREDRGEIEAAEEGRLPALVGLEDILGDLHCHTRASDGNASVREMALAARELGYRYLGIADHSQNQSLAGGLSREDLAKQIEEIDALNEEIHGIRILKGCEVDILENGDLDFNNDLLKRLDYTVCAVHGQFRLSREKQTERILRAMDNPYFNILAHPTGRLLNERPAYQIDLPRILQAAKERDCIAELNALPARLDLDDINCRMARDTGVLVAISSDAHSTGDLRNMRFGISQAQRGWLEKSDVLNTRSLPEVMNAFRR